MQNGQNHGCTHKLGFVEMFQRQVKQFRPLGELLWGDPK